MCLLSAPRCFAHDTAPHGFCAASQNAQWWMAEESVSTIGRGDTSDITEPSKPIDGQLSTAVDGFPVAAKLVHALRKVAARVCWSGVSVPGNGVLGRSNRYWYSEECVAIGGSLGPANRDGALSSLNLRDLAPERADFGGCVARTSHVGSFQRSDSNAARISWLKSSGSSHAAKWPPLSTSLK